MAPGPPPELPKPPPTPPIGTGTPRRREVFGYCMFDFANSSYTTLIVTVAYSTYFRQVVVGHDDPNGDLWWSLSQVAAYVILIVGSPVLGALADYSGRKKAFLLATTVQTVVACAALGLVGPGAVFLGVGLYVVATVGFEGGYVFYNAFLPEVSTPATIGRISGLSWGTGFLGGLTALIACAPLLARPLVLDSGALDPAAIVDRRWSFVVVAGFFAVFAVPTFLYLRERGEPAGLSRPVDYVNVGFRRVAGTLGHLRRYRAAGLFVLAALFFYGGIDAVIKFAAIYASQTFGIQGNELLLLFIVTNLIAVPGTLAAGWLADHMGSRAALAATLVGWMLLLLWGAAATSRVAFWIMAGGVAVGMGATQAIARSFMAQLSPPARESEFFGFYVLASKVGAIIAFLLFGLVSSGSGNQRLGVLWMLPLFAAGLALVLAIRPVPATDNPDNGE